MAPISQEIHINADGVSLNGSLSLCHEHTGIVVFVQGIGSGRFSPRNKHIAHQLQTIGWGVLMHG